MHPLPTHPHDWALWLFDELESLEDMGSYWQGVLPAGMDFAEVTAALPDNIRGVCDASSRTIEFHPTVANVFSSLTELVEGAKRRNVPKIFTVRDLKYTHGRSNTTPPGISQYLGAVKLWQLFERAADHGTGQSFSLYFIKTFESKIELRCEYSATDLCPLENLDEFAKNYFESDHHRDQKRTIIRNTLLEVFKGQPTARLAEVLSKYQEFSEKVRNAYSLYTTDFSFEKLRSELDKQNLDDTLRLNKTVSDIQNQLLAIPAAMLLVGANVKASSIAANFSTLAGVTIFAWIMFKLIFNQLNSISAIHKEIDLRKSKIEEQPKEISEKLLPNFEDLNKRVAHQESVLKGIRISVSVVWTITVVLIFLTQWPEIGNYLINGSINLLEASRNFTCIKFKWFC